MVLLLVFSIVLLIAILFSERAERTILSASVLFLVAGALAGEGFLDLIVLDDPLIGTFAELALFAVLFSDGIRLSISELSSSFRLPGRALLVGLPLTLVFIAALSHWLMRLPWMESLLLGAVLCPTDPVLVSAIVGRKGIPESLRKLLTIESGLNDGLALPVVIVLIRVLGKSEVHLVDIVLELAAGLAIGILVPWLIIRIERSRFFQASSQYTPMMPLAAAFLVFALCHELHANEYLAAFTAGVTIASLHSDLEREFHTVGEPVTEMLKLAALLVFGTLFSKPFLTAASVEVYVFAVLVLVAARPIALSFSLIGSRLPRKEFLAAAWFGPKGFASVSYALLVLHSGIGQAEPIFHIAAIVTALSIVAHSSTDVPFSNWLMPETDEKQEQHKVHT